MTGGVPAGERIRQHAGQADSAAGGAAGGAADRAKQRTKQAGREAAGSKTLQLVGRLGLICRGVLYGLIGILALQVAFGDTSEEADSAGALRVVSDTPIGSVVLWLLAIGFAGLALWQLAEAIFARGVEAKDRLVAVGRVVVYTALCVSVVLFLAGDGQQSGQGSSDQKSQAFTARAMENAGGRLLVGAVGLALLVAGAVFAYRGLRRTFLENLDLDRARPTTRRVIETLGLVGNVARGVVFGAVGGFVLQAAITFDANKAKGLDGSLRSFADTPLGPWLLVAVALGLVLFGVYSCLQSWYQRTRAAAST